MLSCCDRLSEKTAAYSSSHTTFSSAVWLCCSPSLRGGAPPLESGWSWDLSGLGECGRNKAVWLPGSGLRKLSSFPFCLLRTQLPCKEAQARLLNEKRERATCPSSKRCSWGAKHVSIAVLNIPAPVPPNFMQLYKWLQLRSHAADEPPRWAQSTELWEITNLFLKALCFGGGLLHSNS